MNQSLTSVLLCLSVALIGCEESTPITSRGESAVLNIYPVSANSIRVLLKPISFTDDFAENPALSNKEYKQPAISLSDLHGNYSAEVGSLKVDVSPSPLSIVVSAQDGRVIQRLVFDTDSTLTFGIDEQPILGMGEGGPRQGRDSKWRELPIEFDRRGRYHNMQPRWQSNAYGSRNPVPLLFGTSGWGLFCAAPWVQVDLRDTQNGRFVASNPNKSVGPQTEQNQGQNLGKGLPPADLVIPGLWDVFIFDALDPAKTMSDVAEISGHSVLPPKWALGYMQSHRTLENEEQMIGIVKTFREKKIPVDAVIYLGTGFCPQGWNEEQPSFEFSKEVFRRDPIKVIDDLHELNVKVAVHIVPWDRDKLPTLHGTIPAKSNEILDEGHIKNYWDQHLDLINSGIDAFWPDEGDWFDLHERIKRHQLYYQGPLSTTQNERPWSLHRNGYLGIGKWGGWVWSGDTQSAWKTLEGQIAVGINYSLSISPYWGSDIGGFYPDPGKTGEMYARWFQFGAFCPSFRSHGRTWFTALPWGFGLSDMGPREVNNRNDVTVEGSELRLPKPESMNDSTLEPVTRKYAELRYQLMPYVYSMSWEAYTTGLPMMRALWLHYQDDQRARGIGDEYLWGRDLLIAPVYEEGATERKLYLPKGLWYDWWTNSAHEGGKDIIRKVDLATMPIYARAGSIIPFDPIRQFMSEKISTPTTIRIYTGADGNFSLYEDDGISQKYLDDEYTITDFSWNDSEGILTIETKTDNAHLNPRSLILELLPEGKKITIGYDYTSATVDLK